MAAETSWPRYGTKSRNCHPMYVYPQNGDRTVNIDYVTSLTLHVRHCDADNCACGGSRFNQLLLCPSRDSTQSWSNWSLSRSYSIRKRSQVKVHGHRKTFLLRASVLDVKHQTNKTVNNIITVPWEIYVKKVRKLTVYDKS